MYDLRADPYERAKEEGYGYILWAIHPTPMLPAKLARVLGVTMLLVGVPALA
jgi:hypothetical protein